MRNGAPLGARLGTLAALCALMAIVIALATLGSGIVAAVLTH